MLSYNISTFKLNGNAEVLSPATQTDQYQNTDSALGDDPCVVLDQYLGRVGLDELVLGEGNVSDNDLP